MPALESSESSSSPNKAAEGPAASAPGAAASSISAASRSVPTATAAALLARPWPAVRELVERGAARLVWLAARAGRASTSTTGSANATDSSHFMHAPSMSPASSSCPTSAEQASRTQVPARSPSAAASRSSSDMIRSHSGTLPRPLARTNRWSKVSPGQRRDDVLMITVLSTPSTVHAPWCTTGVARTPFGASTT